MDNELTNIITTSKVGVSCVDVFTIIVFVLVGLLLGIAGVFIMVVCREFFISIICITSALVLFDISFTIGKRAYETMNDKKYTIQVTDETKLLWLMENYDIEAINQEDGTITIIETHD